MARNPIYDILEEKTPEAPAATKPNSGRNPIYDILPTKEIVIPKDTIRFGGGTGSEERFRMLNPQVQEQLIGAAQEYYQKTGKPLQVNSGFRTPEDQKRLYDETIAAGRPGVGPSGMPVAKPGESKHQMGVVLDIQQGKSDPVAQQILAGRGFTQPLKNDPVHFEYIGPSVIPAPTPSNVVGPAPQREAIVQPSQQAPVEAPGPLRTAQAGLAGITQGTFAGLGQYPAALGLSAASYLFPQGQPLSPKEALAQVRESQQSLREDAPLAYGAGEIGGSLAGFGKAAGLARGATATLPRAAGAAASMGATQKYTESPETTLGEAATTGAISGGATVALGGVGRLAEWGLAKVGEKTLKSSVNQLVKNKDELNRVFGPAYEEVKTIALSQKPTMESVRAQILREAPDLAKKNPRTGNMDVDSKLVLKELNRQTSAWKADNAGIGDIRTFAQRYAENPQLLQKYTTTAPTTAFGGEVAGAARNLQKMEGSNFARQAVGQGLVGLSGAAGLGGAGGALIGYLTEKDPLLSALGGGTALPLALAAGRFGGTTQYLNPMSFPSAAGMAAGSQGYKLGDLFKRGQ
jgi:hypothetical protein